MEQKSDDKVVVLRKPPNPAVISALEAALEEARAGRLTSVSICGVAEDRDGWHAWHFEDRDYFVLCGIAATTLQRLAAEAVHRSEPL